MNMNSDASKNWINSSTAGNLKMTKNETFFVFSNHCGKVEGDRCIDVFPTSVPKQIQLENLQSKKSRN